MALTHVLIVDDEEASDKPATRHHRLLDQAVRRASVRDVLERTMVWHKAEVASGAPRSASADPDAGLQAWLDSLE